ncbi:MAG: LuxR C-terminal-related transcriptional regulator [Proteobacteria bacterium]|nr:LuxR C-terminal-related transcriptional regulator [Pseudomonadota bacterium]
MALKVMLAREEGRHPEKIIELCKNAMNNLGEGDRTLKGTVLLNIGLTHITTGEFEKARVIIEDVKLMEKGSDNFYAAACAAYFSSWIDFVQGRLGRAAAICNEALSSIRSITEVHIPIVDCLTVFLSHIWVERNEQDKTEEVLTASIESMRLVKEWGFLSKGLTTLVRLKMARKEPMARILKVIDEISDMERYRESAKILAASLKIRWLLSNANSRPQLLREAEKCAEDHHIDLSFYPLYQKHFQYEEWHLAAQFALARIVIMRKRKGGGHKEKAGIQDVLTYLDKRLKQQWDMRLIKRVIEIHILKAMAYDACKQPDEALISLSAAISLAGPEGYVRLFIEEGEPMKKLLSKIADNGESLEYIGHLRNAFKKEALATHKHGESALPEPLVEPLSERELEVLRLVASGHSNQEIAKQLFVSEGTIKKHNYNIFSKLQVKKRTQAVVSAKQLGLIQ